MKSTLFQIVLVAMIVFAEIAYSAPQAHKPPFFDNIAGVLNNTPSGVSGVQGPRYGNSQYPQANSPGANNYPGATMG